MKIEVLNNQGNKYMDQYTDLMSYCFRMCTKESFVQEWENTGLKEGAILGSIDEVGILASSVTVTHREIFVEGKRATMGGVGAVATAGQYRSGGVCSNLIKESLKYMHEKDMVFSMLAPFSYQFYQKFGWKWCYEKYVIEVPMAELKPFRNKGKFEMTNENNKAELDNFYHKRVGGYNGACVRTDKHWKKRLDSNDGWCSVIYKNLAGDVEGYMIYKIMHETLEFMIKEIVFTTQEAVQSLFNFAYVHDAQAHKVVITSFAQDYILDVLQNPRVKCVVEPYMMGRIVDVVKAMTYYTFNGTGSIVIKVNDDTCEWNNKTFKVDFNKGEVIQVAETTEALQVEVDIRELTQLVLGFRTLTDLTELERVKVLDEEVRKHFKGTRSKVALYDFF